MGPWYRPPASLKGLELRAPAVELAYHSFMMGLEDSESGASATDHGIYFGHGVCHG